VTELLLELPATEGAMLIVATHSLELAARLQQRRMLDEGRLRTVDPETPLAATPDTSAGERAAC
jgi:ABC-type lipoprotein export system ATPase subunit